MADPSPQCEIKIGAAAYVTAVGGVDSTLGATVIIRLADQAGVDSWQIECVTTDETSDADTINASLTIDADAKTATFTAPSSLGTALRFRSRVNGGFDRNGIARPHYSTTFCIYTLTSAGRRVIAADETTEGDSEFGWIKWVNSVNRSTPSGVSAGAFGANYQFQYYSNGTFAGATGLDYSPTTQTANIRFGFMSGTVAMIQQATISNLRSGSGLLRNVDFIGQATLTSALIRGATMMAGMIGSGATAATGMHLVRPIMAGPVMGGTAVFTGTDLVANGMGDHTPFSVIRGATTSDATITTLFTWAIPDESISNVVAEMNAVPSGGAAGGSYGRSIMIRADGGIATCGSLESTWNREHTASGVGFTGIAVGSGVVIGVSGLSGFVNVKGTATGRIKWGGTITVTTTTWA